MNNKGPRPNLSTDEAYLTKTRDLVKGREGPPERIHFEYLNEVLSELGIHSDVYSNLSSVNIPEGTKAAIDTAFERLQSETQSQGLQEKLHRLWDHLAESDPLEKADLIFVFGGTSELAVREAIRLKQEGYAPRILFTGKHGSYMKGVNDLSEAEKYAQLAEANGVSRKDMVLETEAVNTVENVINSSKILQSEGIVPKSIIAVGLPYHMRRGAYTLREAAGFEFKLIRHVGPSAKYSRETYFKDKNGWSYICNEYVKLFMAWKVRHP